MKGIFLLLLVAVVMAAIYYGPIITIWALNTLFGLDIPVNWATWGATLWLTFLMVPKPSYSSN
jgi:hypothetical protein